MIQDVDIPSDRISDKLYCLCMKDFRQDTRDAVVINKISFKATFEYEVL